MSLLNRKRAAEHVGVNPKTIDSWVRAGMPVLRRGRIIRIDPDAMRGWLANGGAAKRGRPRKAA